MSKIAFVIKNVRPGTCGVTDYCSRMALTLSNDGHHCALIGTESIPEEHLSPEIPIRLLRPEEVSQFDIVAIQYIPDLKASGKLFFAQIAALRHPNIHLMIHEFFRISSRQHPLTIKERIKSRLQLYQLRSLIRRLRPHSISTSNEHYQKTLLRYGIKTSVSPMPGTIPLYGDSSKPVEIVAANWFHRQNNDFIWVVFGNLYTSFWDCSAYFHEIRRLSESLGGSHRWVICGRQPEDEQSRFLAAASASGFEKSVLFTGAIAARSVDWLMRHADASLSGTSGGFWQKSTGVLVALERGIPIYFPREKSKSIGSLGEATLYQNLEQLVSDRLLSPGLPKLYEGRHTPKLAVESFLHIVGQDC